MRSIRIFEVETGPFGAGKVFPGVARASQQVDLSFRFPGRLLELPIEEGRDVIAGDLIARLDFRDLEARQTQVLSELESARARLSQMQAGARPEDLRRLESNLDARRSQFEEAERQLERMRQLLEEGVVSQAEFEAVRTQAEVARSAFEAAQEELLAAQAGARVEEVTAQQAVIRGIQARLAEVENSLIDAEIRAPFNGVISQKLVENFQDVQALQPVARLQNIARIQVQVNLTEADMAAGIQDGIRAIEEQRVVAYARFPALPGMEIPLVPKEFQTEADPATQTFRATLEMEQQPPYPIRPGMNVEVTSLGIRSDRAAGGLHIPVSSLVSRGEAVTSVWIIDPETERVSLREVQTGEVHRDQVRILSGLEPGERIAASAVNTLREGMRVQQMTDPREL